MGTPIYDDLMGRARSEDPQRQSGPEVATSCAWCGTPVWGDSGAVDGAVEFEVDDSETGEPVTLAVCTAEHRTALEEHRTALEEHRTRAGGAHPGAPS